MDVKQSLLTILQSSSTTSVAPLPVTLPSSFQPNTGGNLLPKESPIVVSQQNVQCTVPLESQTITIVPTKLEYRKGRSISVSNDFICYAVRGGKIRIIAQVSGDMILLREHIQSVLDMTVSGSLLASVSLDDSIACWSLALEPEIT
jgi:hypothetical protein